MVSQSIGATVASIAAFMVVSMSVTNKGHVSCHTGDEFSANESVPCFGTYSCGAKNMCGGRGHKIVENLTKCPKVDFS
jgi:hypothetical protein